MENAKAFDDLDRAFAAFELEDDVQRKLTALVHLCIYIRNPQIIEVVLDVATLAFQAQEQGERRGQGSA